MKRPRRNPEPSALELVEEAVHLLRRAPAETLALYYAGTVPFVLALLFFWAHTTWFQPSGERVAWSALALVGLFAVMKAAQAGFCARLLAVRLGAAPAPLSARRLGRALVTQLRLQPWALLATLLAAFFAIPFGWVYAYAQNLTVLGDEEKLHGTAVAQAQLWPRQNHLGLLMISILALLAWMNLAAAFFLVPWLANRLLGIDNIFGFSGWWFFNTTFLASVTALTWLALDPLVKAFYTLRVFHGRARRTGEDVRVELNLARRAAAGTRVLAAAVVLLLAPLATLRGGDAPPVATTPAAPAPAVPPARLDRAIEEVLAGPEFRWRLRPPEEKPDPSRDGPIKRFIRRGFDYLGEMANAIGRSLKRFVDWLERVFSRKQRDAERVSTSSGAGAAGLLTTLLYVFIAVAVLLILWVIWLLVKHARRHAAPVVAATALATAAPDLRDENIQAAQLPVDGWLALAQEQAARGEWRLALRALYLATLARLARDGLISLAKFKTNLDYEREVRRRALSRAEIAAQFARRRREFEDVWYGHEQPGEAQVRAWMAELERPAAP